MAISQSDLRERLQAAVRDHYVLDREVGHGGMGVVFQAHDLTLDRTVAIKVVQPDLASHATVGKRFLTEARTIARLKHPNIVAVHTAGELDGLLYYVMDHVDGESLRQRLNREGPLPTEQARDILKDVAAALEAAAEAGVVHRDIKPANVLLDRETGRAMLVDFGIARITGGDGTAEITGDGLVLGTPTYMSPEQAAGEEIDARSDLYSLGVVAYEMLAGKPPFEGSHRLVVSHHIGTRPQPINKVRPDCPDSLAHAVMRALEKPVHERWQTGSELRHAADSATVPTKRRYGVAAAGAVAAIIVMGVLFGLNRSDPNRIPDGVNPRHSMLVLPFDNLREDRDVEWLREGSLSMISLNLSQWDDLHIVDHRRVHDLLARNDLQIGDDIGLSVAQELAREAGVWTVVLGEFDQAGDSLHLTARVYDVATGERVDLATVSGVPGSDIRPLFDQLAADLLDLSGAPVGITTGIASATTNSLAGFRAYLSGVAHLNRWELGDAVDDLEQATVLDSTFGLAYYYLAVGRGWLYGTSDPVSDHAIAMAGRYSDSLPLQQRTLIRAYRALLEGDMAMSRQYYQELLDRNPDDAEAWYGLADAWFHDEDLSRPESRTNSLRAFKRTLQLDPGFTLAFDHINSMLHSAGLSHPYLALVEPDSFVWARSEQGETLMDSVSLVTAVERARRASLELARSWVAKQPNGLRAQNALIDAYVSNGQYQSALAEADQIEADGEAHPEMPFVRARIFFAADDPERAGETLREALDSVAPLDFNALDPSFNLVRSVEASANVFAYQGDLTNAGHTIQFADQVRTTLELRPVSDERDVDPLMWQRWRMGHLYAATGAPVANQRRIWESAAEAARRAAPEERQRVARTGAPAALGIFLQTNDTTALTELRALSGDDFSPEVRAWLALERADGDEARDILGRAETDSVKSVWDYWPNSHYRKPMAAELYFSLGDYYKTLALLEEFEPDRFAIDWFDVRWGMIGRVRMLRAMAYEQLGQIEEAQQQYRDVIAQWQSSDESMEHLLRNAESELARLSGQAG